MFCRLWCFVVRDILSSVMFGRKWCLVVDRMKKDYNIIDIQEKQQLRKYILFSVEHTAEIRIYDHPLIPIHQKWSEPSKKVISETVAF